MDNATDCLYREEKIGRMNYSTDVEVPSTYQRCVAAADGTFYDKRAKKRSTVIQPPRCGSFSTKKNSFEVTNETAPTSSTETTQPEQSSGMGEMCELPQVDSHNKANLNKPLRLRSLEAQDNFAKDVHPDWEKCRRILMDLRLFSEDETFDVNATHSPDELRSYCRLLEERCSTQRQQLNILKKEFEAMYQHTEQTQVDHFKLETLLRKTVAAEEQRIETLQKELEKKNNLLNEESTRSQQAMRIAQEQRKRHSELKKKIRECAFFATSSFIAAHHPLLLKRSSVSALGSSVGSSALRQLSTKRYSELFSSSFCKTLKALPPSIASSIIEDVFTALDRWLMCDFCDLSDTQDHVSSDSSCSSPSPALCSNVYASQDVSAFSPPTQFPRDSAKFLSPGYSTHFKAASQSLDDTPARKRTDLSLASSVPRVPPLHYDDVPLVSRSQCGPDKHGVWRSTSHKRTSSNEGVRQTFSKPTRTSDEPRCVLTPLPVMSSMVDVKRDSAKPRRSSSLMPTRFSQPVESSPNFMRTRRLMQSLNQQAQSLDRAVIELEKRKYARSSLSLHQKSQLPERVHSDLKQTQQQVESLRQHHKKTLDDLRGLLRRTKAQQQDAKLDTAL